MHEVIVAKACMNSAQQCVDERLEMLGADGWQAYDPDSVALCGRRSEISPTVCRDFMSHLRQPFAGLFIVGFDSAIFAGNSASAYIGNSKRRFKAHGKPATCRFIAASRL